MMKKKTTNVITHSTLSRVANGKGGEKVFKNNTHPLNKPKVSIVALLREHTELSSFVASSTISLFGEAFFLRMARAVSLLSSPLERSEGLISLDEG